MDPAEGNGDRGLDQLEPQSRPSQQLLEPALSGEVEE
jgi:hypothetical protein